MFIFFKNILNLIRFFSLKTEKKFVVFYSENKNYRNYLKPLLIRFSGENKYKTVYVTSDNNDVENIDENIEIFFIGKGLTRLIFFTILNCDFLITTLSNLNNNIKISKNCKKMVYVPHSLCSTHKVYEKEAFQHFDIFFSSGDYQKIELRKAEKEYQFKEKKILNVGYIFFENFKIKEKNHSTSEKKTIIFAPSWQRNSKNLLNDFGDKIIQKLLEKNFRIYLRLHPEAVKRSSSKLKYIKSKFEMNKNFVINTDLENFSHFEKSEMLITDNGGVALEYVYIFKKPVLYINYQEKIQNKDFKRISVNTLEDTFKKNFCYQIQIKDLNNIDVNIDHIIKKDSEKIINGINFLKKNIYTNKKASDEAFKFIDNLWTD